MLKNQDQDFLFKDMPRENRKLSSKCNAIIDEIAIDQAKRKKQTQMENGQPLDTSVAQRLAREQTSDRCMTPADAATQTPIAAADGIAAKEDTPAGKDAPVITAVVATWGNLHVLEDKSRS